MECYPLTFAEYLHATGHADAAALILAPPKILTDIIHSFLCDELRKFLFIGGMPESVKTFATTGSMRESFDVQREIAETYRLDFAKYTPQVDKHCLNAILTTTARSIGQQTKYSRLTDDFSNPTIKRAYTLLTLAGILKKIESADPSGIPLGAHVAEKVFKTLILDVGLMRHISGMPTDVEYATPDLLSIYRGSVAEQFVGQELAVSQKGLLYYWSRQEKSSNAEVDFCVTVEGKIVPIEVKSGASGRLKSLHLLLKTYPTIDQSFVFSTNHYSELPEAKIKFIPLYFAYSATGGRGTL